MIRLSMLVPSVTVWNVWDLPLWAWRSYAAVVDAYEAELRKEARAGQHG